MVIVYVFNMVGTVKFRVPLDVCFGTLILMMMNAVIDLKVLIN